MSYATYSPPGSPRMYADRVIAEAKARDAAALAAAEAANARAHSIVASEERMRSGHLSSVALAEGQRASNARVTADIETRQGLTYEQTGLSESARSRQFEAQAAGAHARGAYHSTHAAILDGHSAGAAHLSALESSLGSVADARSLYAPTYFHSHLDRLDAAHAYGRSSACAAEAAILRSGADAHMSNASVCRAEAASASVASLSSSAAAHRNFMDADRSHRSAERARLESSHAELAASNARTGAAAASMASARAEISADLSAQASANAQTLASVCEAQAVIDGQLAANYETACTRRALSNSQSPQRVGYASPYAGSPYTGSPLRGSPLVGSPLTGSPLRSSYIGSPHREYESPLKGSPYRSRYY
eukprot:TRINITY_DN29279_c0_g1_i1.p1 TRINITY_DN29279_c0_g1~~TRINITY_DN29279_c0_g1_i1.p1  ORF type:complete len:379 (+),score=43.79 TRINITY_DN29279_c0_g1_i1:45-1139(+)